MRIIAAVTPGWRQYSVFDVRACRMRLDVCEVDDELNEYVEGDLYPFCIGFVYTASRRTVKSIRVIIPPTPGVILINAVEEDPRAEKLTDFKIKDTQKEPQFEIKLDSTGFPIGWEIWREKHER